MAKYYVSTLVLSKNDTTRTGLEKTLRTYDKNIIIF